MASAITYDGVESAEGGNIFQGIAFWVAQRVPMRTDLLSKIKSNGGNVVPLERSADFLIADHARKDAPPGSFSWRLITDSVENGALQVVDRYRIGPDPSQPRPPSGSGLTRSGRVPYSHADDAELAKWILSNPGGLRHGNKLYQDLEQKNSRHTWQSWRNRWVKSLSKMSDHDLKMLAATASDPDTSQESSVEKSDAVKQKAALPPLASNHDQPASQNATSAAPPQMRRIPFTEDDDAILARCVLANSLVPVTNTFKALAEEYPRHTWESWKTRWNKKVRLYDLNTLKRMAEEHPEEMLDLNQEPEPEPAANDWTAAAHAETAQTGTNQRLSTLNAPMEVKISTSEPRITTPIALKPALSPPRRPAADAVETCQTKGQGQQDQVSYLLPDVTEGSDAQIKEAAAKGSPSLGSQEEQEGRTEAEEVVDEEAEDDDPSRDQFYRDLISFSGCMPEQFDWPVLRGPLEDYDIDLYELAQAYDAQQVEPQNVNWADIGRELGWDPEEETWIPAALQNCFRERLLEFLEAINELEPALSHEGEDEGIEEEQSEKAEQEGEPGLETTAATMPSSPPIRCESPKRPWQADHIPSAASVRKRRRLKDAEIPSTPDKEVGISRDLRQRHGVSASPSTRRSGMHHSQQLPQLQQTPSKLGRRVEEEEDCEESSLRPLFMDEFLEDARSRLPVQKSSDEELPALASLIAVQGTARTDKALRRSLPATFTRNTAPPLLDPPSLPQPRSSPVPNPPSSESVSDWLSRHLRTGYPQHILDLALHHTTLTPGPSADHVVDSLANDNGIPTELPGVWLPEEDRTVRQLMSTDLSEQASSALELIEQKRLREEQRRLIHRHTWEGLTKRKKYLKRKMADEDEARNNKNKSPLRPKVQEQSYKDIQKRDTVQKTTAGATKPLLWTDEEKKRRELVLRRLMEED